MNNLKSATSKPSHFETKTASTFFDFCNNVFERIAEFLENTEEKFHDYVQALKASYSNTNFVSYTIMELMKNFALSLVVLFLSCGFSFTHTQGEVLIHFDRFETIWEDQNITWDWDKCKADGHVLLDNLFNVAEFSVEYMKNSITTIEGFFAQDN